MAETQKVKVFISWSGALSRAVAVALKDWIPMMFDGVETFMSEEDIHSGERGLPKIEAALAESSYGIIVTTRDNQNSQWLNFEAGAISKVLSGGREQRVTPILIDLDRAEVTGPLTQFQYEEGTEVGMRKVANSIAAIANVNNDAVEARFSAFWPELETKLTSAANDHRSSKTHVKRSTEEMLTELLELTRGISRDLKNQPSEENRLGPSEPTDWVHATTTGGSIAG